MTKFAYPIERFRFLFLALTMLWAVQAIAQESASNPPQATKTAAETYKNIQVLKDLPASDLMPTMKSFASSLGVKCTFCHVMGAFEKDDVHKKDVARKMILMARQINTDNFHGHMRVTCWTCHRGAEEPPAHETEQPK